MVTKHLARVQDVKHPLKVGNAYLVPCIVKEEHERIYITPVINHPHTDRENGQAHIHYHVDYRFVKHRSDKAFPTVINNHSRHYFVDDIRPSEEMHGKLEYFLLPVINEAFTGITPVEFISKSKLKHKCIHKGKCPHRGYDLSQVAPIDGKITCPLHGLEFDADTGKVLNAPK
jgi:hypothetical protein